MTKYLLAGLFVLGGCAQLQPAVTSVPVPPQAQTCFSVLVSAPSHDIKTLLNVAEQNVDCATLAQEIVQLAIRAALLAIQ